MAGGPVNWRDAWVQERARIDAARAAEYARLNELAHPTTGDAPATRDGLRFNGTYTDPNDDMTVPAPRGDGVIDQYIPGISNKINPYRHRTVSV